jgi:hypothetical protein
MNAYDAVKISLTCVVSYNAMRHVSVRVDVSNAVF